MAEGELRLFIAVPLPVAPRDACRVVIDTARANADARGIRWVRTENLHVTLRFLGATDTARVPEISDALRGVARAGTPFAVTLAGVGVFPAGRRPRALWIGIERGADDFARLAGALNESLAAVGWTPEERPFRPHLTVARTDAAHGGAGGLAADALAAAARDWRVEFTADTMSLFRSELGAGPPRYEPIDEFPLGR